MDTTLDRGWLPDTQVLDWLERADPERRPWGQNTLAGLCYPTSSQSSGVLITAFMTQVARGDGLFPFEGLPDDEAHDSRGRLAGILVYATLDPPRSPPGIF